MHPDPHFCAASMSATPRFLADNLLLHKKDESSERCVRVSHELLHVIDGRLRATFVGEEVALNVSHAKVTTDDLLGKLGCLFAGGFGVEVGEQGANLRLIGVTKSDFEINSAGTDERLVQPLYHRLSGGRDQF